MIWSDSLTINDRSVRQIIIGQPECQKSFLHRVRTTLGGLLWFTNFSYPTSPPKWDARFCTFVMRCTLGK